jgi:hypothetical protein
MLPLFTQYNPTASEIWNLKSKNQYGLKLISRCGNIKYYVEINCQLDATDAFLLQILLLAQRVSGTIMPIIRSSRVLYKWFLPVVFGAWFSSCSYGVELRVMCPVCGRLSNGAARKMDT